MLGGQKLHDHRTFTYPFWRYTIGTMLDDLKYIHERDAQDALGIAEKQWQQYQHDYAFAWKPDYEIHDVVIAGMGGSSLAAKVFQSWPGLDVPMTIVNDYELPSHVNKN